jgi:hypothetical protein
VPVYKTVLVVSFDPDAVDALVAGSGLRYWTRRGPSQSCGWRSTTAVARAWSPASRPTWSSRWRRAASNAACATCCRPAPPREQAAVRSVVGLNAMALARLTARYGNDAQLLGKVYRQPPAGPPDWLMTQGGVEIGALVLQRRRSAPRASPRAWTKVRMRWPRAIR